MDECIICYKEYNNKNKVVLPCRHHLCESCFKKMKKYNNTLCPCCRRPLSGIFVLSDNSEIKFHGYDSRLIFYKHKILIMTRFIINLIKIINKLLLQKSKYSKNLNIMKIKLFSLGCLISTLFYSSIIIFNFYFKHVINRISQ